MAAQREDSMPTATTIPLQAKRQHLKGSVVLLNARGSGHLLQCSHKSFFTLKSRLGSFDGWPTNVTQTPRELSEAGFFWEGPADKTTCFFCGLALNDWEAGEDPWMKHCQFSKRCLYVILNKGVRFVDVVLSDPKIFDVLKKGLKKGYVSRCIAIPSNITYEEDLSISPPLTQRRYRCKICSQREMCVLYLPCCHLAACSFCANVPVRCPICLLTILAAVPVHVQ